MSKSILVIDTPEACIGCPCCFADNVTIWCGKKRKALCEPMKLPKGIEKFKPDWCPLLDLPEKREVPLQYPYLHQLIADGWNACIDEILKGANEE